MVLGGCTHLLVTSAKSAGQFTETEIASNHELAHLALPVFTCAGSRPAVFPPLFFAPSLMVHVQILATFVLATWKKNGLSHSMYSAIWGAKCQWIDIKHA